MVTITAALAHGTTLLVHLPTARRDAELLLLAATGKDKVFFLTHPAVGLTPEEESTYKSWLARRGRHEPIQYITGKQEFYGLAFEITPDVLIPRPETEHLVEAVLERARGGAGIRIVDVGTGSGAIAVALAHTLPQARITALDCSVPALAVARRNAERHGVTGRIRLVESNLLAAVAAEKFDIVASNPPYVAESEILEEQVQNYEPHAALFAGPAGLEIYRRLIPQAWRALGFGGWLLMEIGHGQQEDLEVLLEGWEDVTFLNDLQGIPRVVRARRS